MSRESTADAGRADAFDALNHVHAEVDRLADAVDELLAGRSAEPDTFPDIAHTALLEARPRLDAETLIPALTVQPFYPSQADPGSVYGEPGVTVARGDGYYIDTYLHIKTQVSAHDHSFAGAFAMVGGVAGHIKWTHEAPPERTHGLVLGRLVPEKVEALSPGEARKVPPGFGMIHSLMHVQMPSVSVVVRTGGVIDGVHMYFLPGIGFEYQKAFSETGSKKSVLLDTLMRLRDPAIGDRLVALINSSVRTTAVALCSSYKPWDGAPPLREVLASSRYAGEAWIDLLCEAIDRRSEYPLPQMDLTVTPRQRLEGYASTIVGPEPLAQLLAAYDEAALATSR